MKNDQIPTEIHEVYEPVSDDVCHLHRRWKLFCDLYASGEKVIQLLNNSAPGFFRMCQESLADDVLLGITRLMEKKVTLGKDNLTLHSLVVSVDATTYPTLSQTLDKLFAAAKAKTAFAKEQRDKRIAHADRATRLEVRLLSVPNKTEMEDALKSIRDLMNAIELHFNKPLYVDDVNVAYVAYSRPLHNDAQQLIARLQQYESPSEYDFDYSKAKPNRFASRTTS